MLSVLLHTDRNRPWVDRDGPTQADLIVQAQRIAALLEGRGQGHIALSCRHARSYVPGLLGAWLAGATVELLPNVQPGTLDRVDADASVAHVLHDDPARQGRSPKAIFVPGVVAGAHKGALGREESRIGADADTRSINSGLGPIATPAKPSWPVVAVRMTTSGTTERPKYVTKTMAQLTGELDVLAKAIPPAACVLSTVPLSHLYGLLWGALLPLRFGARIVSHEALLPADIATLVERDGVDLMISTPAHLRAMAAATMPKKLRVITSGARMPADLHMALAATHEWHVTDVLGSTETGGIATRQHPMNAWAALPGVKVSAPNGQLVVESPWCGGDRVELDDRVEMRHGGTFQYLGRNTELVKIAGKRAHAHAIEATVLTVPGVTDVALLVHAAAGKEPRVALAITVAPGKTVGREEIAAAVRQHFDAVFVPKIVKVVPRIPRSERGKVEVETLRELLGVNTAPTTSTIPIRRVADGQYTAEIPHELIFFRGHFDAFAILPGAVLVERLVWPVVLAELPDITGLRAIKRLRFRRPVFPGQQVNVTVKREQSRLSFEVSSAENVVASGQLVVD